MNFENSDIGIALGGSNDITITGGNLSSQSKNTEIITEIKINDETIICKDVGPLYATISRKYVDSGCDVMGIFDISQLVLINRKLIHDIQTRLAVLEQDPYRHILRYKAAVIIQRGWRFFHYKKQAKKDWNEKRLPC